MVEAGMQVTVAPGCQIKNSFINVAGSLIMKEAHIIWKDHRRLNDHFQDKTRVSYSLLHVILVPLKPLNGKR